MTTAEPELAKPTASADPSGRDRFGRNVAFAWGGYFVNVVAGFVIPRLITDRLGQTTLGIWDFAWSIVSYFGLVQLGLGSSVNRYVAKYRATGNTVSLSRSVSTIALFQRLVGWLAFLVAVLTAWLFLPMFGNSLGSGLETSRWVVLFLGAEIALSIMLTVYGSVITGCHRWDIHNSVSAISYGLIAVAMIIVLVLGGGLPALALSHCVFSVGGELARWRIARRVCPELTITARLASWSMFREQARYSAKSLVPRVADLVSNQALSILVTMFLGPASLAVFSRPKGLMRTLQALAAKFGFILVPTASSMQAGNNRAALRATLKQTPGYISALVLPVILALAVLGNYVILLWMGEKYVYPGLMPILALGALAPLIQEPVWSILSGMNVHGRIAIAKLVAAIASALLLAAGLGLMKWGLIGAAVCFTLPQIFVDGLVTPIYACRRLGLSLASYYSHTFLRPLLCLMPYLASLCALRWLSHDALSWTITIAIIGCVSSALLYWRFIVPPQLQLKIAECFFRFPWRASRLSISKV